MNHLAELYIEAHNETPPADSLPLVRFAAAAARALSVTEQLEFMNAVADDYYAHSALMDELEGYVE